MPTRQQVHIDQALTNMSVAYMQEAKTFIADQVFPQVPVQKQSDRYFVYLKEDWFRDEAVERVHGAESAGGDYEIDNTPTYFCKLYSYHKDVTEDDRVNSDSPIVPDNDATDFVTSKLLLKRELLWSKKYFIAGVWGHELKGGTAVTTTDAIKWNLAGATPIQDIHEAQTSIQSETGYKPNILVLGPYVYDALRDNEVILDRIKYTQRGVVTTELLAALFEVDKVLIAAAVVNVAQKGATEKTDFIFGNDALLCYAAPRPGIKTPSAGYTFAWKGLLGAGAYGNRMIRLPMDWLGLGTERIEGEMSFDQKVVAKDLGYFFSQIV